MQDYWAGLTRRRLSRQRFLVGASLTAAGGTSALVLGCSSSKNNATSTRGGGVTTATSASGGATTTSASPAARSSAQAAAGAPSAAAQVKLGGTLRYPNSSVPDVFDPAITLHAASWAEGTNTALSGLLRYDEQLNVLPHMADMPQQPDPLTYVFKLKPGIKWHNLPPANGRMFTAEDAVFGLQRFAQPNPEFIYGALLSPIDKYEVIDPQTFKLTLKAPYAPLLSAIMDDWCQMVNREMVDKVGDAGIKKYENLLGTGPWVRGELKPNVSSYLVKNPEYFIKGQPYMDRIETTYVLDATARWSAIRSKQFDTYVFWTGANKQDADQIKSDLGDKVTVQTKQFTAWTPMHFNHQRDPFKDQRVRRALFLAMDRQAQEAALGKGNLVPMAAIPQSLPVYAVPVAELQTMPGYRQPKDQDIADAKKMLAAAGVTGTLKIATRTYPSYAHAIAAQAAMKKIDVDLDLQEGQPVEVLADRQKGNFVFCIASITGAPDPDPFLFNGFHSQGTANYGKYNNSDFDKLATAQRQELDTAKRKQIVRDAQNLLVNDAAHVFTFSGVAYPVAWSYVKGWRITPGLNQGPISAEMWLDKT